MHFLLCLLLPVCRVSCVRPQLFVENSFRPGIILICSVPVVLWQIDFQDVSAGCPQVESIRWIKWRASSGCFLLLCPESDFDFHCVHGTSAPVVAFVELSSSRQENHFLLSLLLRAAAAEEVTAVQSPAAAVETIHQIQQHCSAVETSDRQISNLRPKTLDGVQDL